MHACKKHIRRDPSVTVPSSPLLGRATTITAFLPSFLPSMSSWWTFRVDHASIDYTGGSFFLVNKAPLHCAAIRIGIGTSHRDWPLTPGSAFSVGNSVFFVKS